MAKDTKNDLTPEAAANKADQKNLFAESNIETLKELALAFGIKEDRIPEDATKEQLMELLLAANRLDISVAKKVKTQDGKEYTCPPGHMVIKVTPKALGMEWGARSREVFFFAVNCECVVGKRGEVLVIKDKFRSAWRDAIRDEWSVNEQMKLDDSGQHIQPAKWTKIQVPAEDVMELHWNRDYEAEAAVEADLIAGSKKYMAEKAAEKALRHAVVNLTR